MTRLLAALTFLALAAPADAASVRGMPLALHPDNPHYFLFRGKPAVLVTSGEHYGAVLNGDFDYLPYLDELHARGFNLTRTFSGAYREVPGSFGITENTLAPKPDRFVCPWARSSTPGAGDGGRKFDLEKWDPAYFARLKDFVTQAGKRGIVVELGLFCSIYDDKLWAVNPMKADNNVQGIGKVSRKEVYALKEKELTAVQDALVRKVVTELKDFDNLYYEVCNEPYFGGVSREWNDHIIETIVDAEKDFPGKHLIAQNIANKTARVTDPNPHVSVFNFHYASPPDAVAQNWQLNKVIAFDETGFRGQADLPYRTDAWEFLLAGGAVYSNLDYSFTCSHPDGTARVTTSPGGGGPELRRQLQVLKAFMDSLDFVHMKPNPDVIQEVRATGQKAGSPPTARALVEAGKAYAIYLKGGTRAELVLDLPAGGYSADWLSTRTGRKDRAVQFDHQGGKRVLASPPYSEDVALRVIRWASK